MTKRTTSTKAVDSQQTSKKSGRAKYRVRNWSDYNASLVQRGSITFWISQDVMDGWAPAPNEPRRRGGQKQYSDLAIEALLMTGGVFHLTLRATQGFAQSLFELLDVDISVPNYSTLSRRGQTLNIALPKRAEGSLHMVLDSTGLKVYPVWHGFTMPRNGVARHRTMVKANGKCASMVTANGARGANCIWRLLRPQVKSTWRC